MPRLAFEEPKGGPLAKAAAVEEPAGEDDDPRSAKHRKDDDRDTVLIVLKGAAIVVAIALMGVLIMLATAGGEAPKAKTPTVPEIPDSNAAGPTTTSLAGFTMPEMRTQTTAVVPNIPPPVTTTTTPPPQPTEPTDPRPPGGGQFVRIGDPCPTFGAQAFTESYEPVVCDFSRRDRRLVWRPMFR